MTFATVVKSS